MSINRVYHQPWLWLVVLIFFVGCGAEPVEPDYVPPDSSFGLIYTQIFQLSCAVNLCHDGSGNSPLLKGQATYSTLLDSTVENAGAVQAGLSYVLPFSSDSSFLYQKINFDSAQFKFGSPMPLGGLTISKNEVEFVRQWIIAGAPLQGHVADRSLIE